MGEVSNAFVVAMGIGVVFVGLICIVVLCMVMSRLCRPGGKKVPAEAPAASAAVSKPAEQSGAGEKDIAVLTAVITAAITAAASDRPAAAVPGRRVAAPSSYRPVMPPVYSGPPRHAAAAPVRRPAASKRQEMISAVSAAIAEQSGTDVSGIRILSFKKID